MTKTKPTPRCAMCKAPVTKAYRPFCSRRCADLDLARWLNGRYAIPGPPAAPEDLQGEQIKAEQMHKDHET